MRTRIVLSIGLAGLMIFAVCTALAGHASPTTGYTLTTIDGLALSLSADGQITSLQVDGEELAFAPAPALLLRDLSGAGSVITPNLLVNPGFEDGLAGWTEVLSNGPIMAAVVEQISRHGDMSQVLEFNLEGQPGRSNSHYGSNLLSDGRRSPDRALSASVRRPSANDERRLEGQPGRRGTIAFASDPVSVEPGRRYRLSAWAKSKQGYVSRLAGNAPAMQMWRYREITQHQNGIYVQWLDADQQPLGDPVTAAPLVNAAQTWRLLRGEVKVPEGAANAQIAVAASLQDEETLWFDDVQFVESPEEDDPLGGEVSWVGENRISQTVTAHDLQISVDYVVHDDFIAITGTVQNLRDDEDRALDLTVSLPVEAAGWRFWDDVHHSQTITTGVYHNAISAVSDGWLPMSLYPYAGISGAVEQGSRGAGGRGREGEGERGRQGEKETRREGEEGRGRSDNPQSAIRNPQSVGLAIAQNPLTPQIVWLRYDARADALQATFHLGISPQATELQNRATFDLRLFRFDPTWGFRDVIARYGDFFPQVQRTDFPFGDYSDSAHGTIFRDDPEQMEMLRELQQQGVFLTEYAMTELWFPAITTTIHSARPTLPEIMDVVDAFALPLSELWEEVPALSESAEWDEKAKGELAKAIYHSAAVADNGEWKLKTVAKKAYPVEHWYAIWGDNVDPDLAQGLGRWMLLRRIDPVFDLTEAYDVRLDGVILDNFLAFPVIDRRPEAIANADYGLTYSPVSYKPGVHNGFAMFEFLEALRDRLAQRGEPRAITVNCWSIGHANYLARFIDYFGGEGQFYTGRAEGNNWNPDILDYRRALANRKLLGHGNFTSDVSMETALEFVELAKFYGVYISVKKNEGSWDPEALDIVNATAAFVRPYALAGWEPLTYARADSGEVWVERFGEPTNDGLYFTVHNTTDLTRTTAITIKTVPLGLTAPVSATITDLETDQAVPFSLVAGDIVVELTLGPRATRVLQVEGGVAPPASRCVGDANANGIGDVVDIMTTASELPCHVYLPLVAAQWRQPWPTATPTATPTAISEAFQLQHLRTATLTTDPVAILPGPTGGSPLPGRRGASHVPDAAGTQRVGGYAGRRTQGELRAQVGGIHCEGGAFTSWGKTRPRRSTHPQLEVCPHGRFLLRVDRSHHARGTATTSTRRFSSGGVSPWAWRVRRWRRRAAARCSLAFWGVLPRPTTSGTVGAYAW
ncbi:MAG: hypothetical protein MAG451_00402 [Anaerolineales bacterium]|nr:hypothetical protein [Anaerolineales bacterium]